MNLDEEEEEIKKDFEACSLISNKEFNSYFKKLNGKMMMNKKWAIGFDKAIRQEDIEYVEIEMTSNEVYSYTAWAVDKNKVKICFLCNESTRKELNETLDKILN